MICDFWAWESRLPQISSYRVMALWRVLLAPVKSWAVSSECSLAYVFVAIQGSTFENLSFVTCKRLVILDSKYDLRSVRFAKAASDWICVS